MSTKPKAKPTSNKKLTIKQRNQKFEKNIDTRGKTVVVEDEEAKSNLSPIVVGVLLFAVLGSAVFQIISTATGV